MEKNCESKDGFKSKRKLTLFALKTTNNY